MSMPLLRMAAAAVQGARRRAAAGGVTMDLTALGTFARALEGSYLTGAPGDTTFLAWASSDVRRLEDRGDGAGALLLLEGASTNVVIDSEAITSGNWSTLNSPTLTPDAQDAPDGVTDADRVAFAAGGSPGQVRQTQAAATITAGVPATASLYLRKGNGSDQVQIFFRNRDLTTYTNTVTPASSWGRFALAVATTGTGSNGWLLLPVLEVTDGVDFDVWGVQLETRRSPSSYIRTGSATTRPADSLVIAEADVPASFFTSRWRCPELSPVDGTSDLVSGSERWLFCCHAGNGGLRIRHDGSDVLIEALAGGSVVAESQPLSYARHELLGPIEWDPVAGLVYVDGVAGPSGTPWSWPASDVRIGGVISGTGELYGRVAPVWEEV